jgi:hypothetical protein
MGDEISYKILVRKPERKRHSKNVGIHGRITLD